MDLKDLTPELFETKEFAEKRRGYDIDEVEHFLEETGTAVAQLLVRYRQLEERNAAGEARLAETEARLAEADARVVQQPAPRPAPVSESEDIERATSTLVMAKKTADATIAEAESEAGRVRAEATVRADEIVTEARRTAEEELSTARRHTTAVVTSLESRRDAVASVVEGFEMRIEEYRSQFAEMSDALRAIVDDPAMLAPREPLTVPESAAGYTPNDDGRDLRPDSDPPEVDLTEATQAHDSTTEARDGLGDGGQMVGTGWTPSEGARSPEVAASSDHAAQGASLPGQVRESSVIVDAEPVTGQTSDRFLRELDQAVNESEDAGRGDDAISAFFDGDSASEGRSRFGWRR